MSLTSRMMLHRTVAGVILLSVIPAASADCFIDRFGNETCNGLTYGARIAIGFGILALIMVLLLVFGLQRRRRIQRANQAYITNANNVQAYPVADTYGNSYNSAQGYDPTFVNSQVPQYPPPTHPQSHPGQPGLYPGYDAQAYAPPPGAPIPPQYSSYAPPGDKQ